MLILSGDQLYQMDFAEMIDNHKNAGADITIATIPVGEREATEFGLLKTDETHTITSFIEKPAAELLPEMVKRHRCRYAGHAKELSGEYGHLYIQQKSFV